MLGRYLLKPFQFLHAWLLSRVLVQTCRSVHAVDASPTLVIAPHPDDETLGCGGLIATKRAIGANVTVVFLTDGSAGTLHQEQTPNQGLALRRRGEAVAALDHLCIDRAFVHFWDYPDGALEHLPSETRGELVERLASLMRSERIRAVYVPHRCDGHPDHRTAFALAKAAASMPGPTVRLYQYAIWMWWSQPLIFRLRWSDLSRRTLHRVGAAVERKRRALQCHASQWPRFPLGFLRALPFESELFFEAYVGNLSPLAIRSKRR